MHDVPGIRRENMDIVAHSDFLIHWTGKDIDSEFDTNWWNNKSAIPNKKIATPYIERLKFILKYGLWMTEGKDYVEFNGKKVHRPKFARVSFTELKLSQAREHAKKFGRLGIGFKRMFVLNRMGFPMVYFQPHQHNWFMSPFLDKKVWAEGGKCFINEYWACFLKSMDENYTHGELLQYKQFNESEWRIIYSDEIEQKLDELKLQSVRDYFRRPCDIKDENFQNYLKERDQEGRLKYLIPLNRNHSEIWFAMIIYPNISTKVFAEGDAELRKIISALKPVSPNK